MDSAYLRYILNLRLMADYKTSFRFFENDINRVKELIWLAEDIEEIGMLEYNENDVIEFYQLMIIMKLNVN
jgi:hypothetical protein